MMLFMLPRRQMRAQFRRYVESRLRLKRIYLFVCVFADR
jgi:hypothetical protein